MKKTLIINALLLTICATSYSMAQPTVKINVVWQHSNEPAYDMSLLPTHPQVNVVSPCWYDINNDYGELTDKSISDYVENCHQKGYQVWPLVTSGFKHERMSAVLNDYHARKYVIDQLLEQAKKHKFDGINLDFENINDQDRDKLSNFVWEISQATKNHNLVLSMDITVPSPTPFWSLCFDRKALSKHVDYLMLMAYDQHTPSNGIAGPTAGYNWVEEKLQSTLKLVPANKLILGLPFYSRIWTYDPLAKITTGRTLAMAEANQIIAQYQLDPTWDAQAHQEYYEYLQEDKIIKFWREDYNSLHKKLDLVDKYNLAGSAAWRKGFETKEIWTLW